MSSRGNLKNRKKLKIGKLEISRVDAISIMIVVVLIVVYIFSPRCYSITTGLYNKSTEENQHNVETAMGYGNTEERFKLYF